MRTGIKRVVAWNRYEKTVTICCYVYVGNNVKLKKPLLLKKIWNHITCIKLTSICIQANAYTITQCTQTSYTEWKNMGHLPCVFATVQVSQMNKLKHNWFKYIGWNTQ
jgi:hypothetical protein